MSELLEFATSPWTSVGLVLLLFGVGPSALLRLAVRAYPRVHPRRAELPAEFEQVPFRRRPLWVAALVPVCLDEGIGARRARRFDDRRARAVRRARVQLADRLVDQSDVRPVEEWAEVYHHLAGRYGTIRWVVSRYVVVIDGEEIEVLRTSSGSDR